MRTGLCTDARFREHVAPGEHPERPARLDAIEKALDGRGLRSRCVAVPARAATRAELERVHAPAYLDRLELLVGTPGATGWLDADTYYSPGTWTAALLAAGAAIDLALGVSRGTLDDAAGFVRPPGHHATRDRAMGFCLINNVAVAAAALRQEGARVAIVDYDVHHGNGTEAIFYQDPEVLYASTHQYPFYPGTGALDDRGAGAGRGTNVNVPLPAGTGDAGYLAAFDRVIVPALDRFGADVLILSAGFDAHRRDPLASMKVTEAGYGQLTKRLLDVARGRVVALLEGGYDLEGLAASAATMLSVLLGDAPPPVAADDEPPSPLALTAIERARRLHLADAAR